MTSNMILATWRMAKPENLPDDSDFEYETGDSGGGFDRIRIVFPTNPQKSLPMKLISVLN